MFLQFLASDLSMSNFLWIPGTATVVSFTQYIIVLFFFFKFSLLTSRAREDNPVFLTLLKKLLTPPPPHPSHVLNMYVVIFEGLKKSAIFEGL